jgi:hypothetical protein
MTPGFGVLVPSKVLQVRFDPPPILAIARTAIGSNAPGTDVNDLSMVACGR